MKTSDPLVSVIVPTYNQASFLREALTSLRSQTHTKWEAIIVNNHSDDDTVAAVQGFDDPRFHLVNFNNHGVIAASRNLGISRAKGRYIAFLDSDDLWKPAKIERCVKRLEGGFDWVCHSVLERWDDGRTQKTIHGNEDRARYGSLLYDGNCFATSATMVRKELLQEVNGFDERRDFITAEDYDLWLRIARINDRVSFIQEELGIYRLHETNASGSDLRHFQAECAVISTHFDQEKKNKRLKTLKMKKRYARAYYTIGRKLQNLSKNREALHYFIKSMMKYPFFSDTYISSALAVFRIFTKQQRMTCF